MKKDNQDDEKNKSGKEDGEKQPRPVSDEYGLKSDIILYQKLKKDIEKLLDDNKQNEIAVNILQLVVDKVIFERKKEREGRNPDILPEKNKAGSEKDKAGPGKGGDEPADDWDGFEEEVDDAGPEEGENDSFEEFVEDVKSNYKLIKKRDFEKKKTKFLSRKIPSPREMKAVLDRFVVGQDEAKKSLATAIYNQQIICNEKVRTDDSTILEKGNLLLLGPTGSGKTAMLKKLADTLELPLVIEDVTAFSTTGYVGRDLDSMLRDLIMKAGGDMFKAMSGIIYLDEVDKLARRRSGSGQVDPSHLGLQQGLLKMLEGCMVDVCMGNRQQDGGQILSMDTSGILFVAGGAFDGIEDIVQDRLKQKANQGIGFGSCRTKTEYSREELLRQVTTEDLKAYGMLPEFVGRFQSVATLSPLTDEMLVKILTEPENSLVRQYTELFRLNGAELSFTGAALKTVAKEASSRRTGARGLRGILEQTLRDAMFDIPAGNSAKAVGSASRGRLVVKFDSGSLTKKAAV